MTFSQIEEMINKYTSELEEQEKVFINQATQVNSWDSLLNKNSKKVCITMRANKIICRIRNTFCD